MIYIPNRIIVSFHTVELNRVLMFADRYFLLTHWSFLIGEKYGAVTTIHVRHAYVVTISPVHLPEDRY